MIFPVKARHINKIEKRVLVELVSLVTKIKKSIQSMYQKDVVKKNMLVYY